MPRTGQIIPEYLVPHVQTYINDNSRFTDEAATPVETGVRLLSVFTSSKGEDNVVKTMRSLTEYTEEYGNPNYALYGQPGYMPYAALSTGNAIVHCMRVMPDDATYAAVAICAYYKGIEAVTGETPVPAKLNVKFMAVPLESFTNKAELYLKLTALEMAGAETTEDGYNVAPLFAVCAKGRGMYGNSLRFRVIPDAITNTENDYFNYYFEVLDSSTGAIIKKSQHRGGFDENAVVDNQSLLFDDVLGDPDTGSSKVDIVCNSAGFTAVYDAYIALTDATVETTEPIEQCNLFTGLTKSGSELVDYAIISDDTTVALDSTIGVKLVAGVDGSLAVGAAGRDEAINQLYVSAFNGSLDKSIRSKRSTPAELILDAGYDTSVKVAMAACALFRYDARCIIDAGYISTIAAAETWLNQANIRAISDYIISKECQHYKIRDPFSGKVIPMTYTYYIAANLPNHYTIFGNQVPFVGSTYAQLNGHIKKSLKPEIDADDMTTKEMLYTNRCNFVECIAEDTYVRAVQGTSQMYWSDLSEENNVAVLLEMKRMLEEFVSARLYNFAEAEDRNRFTEAADRMFADFRNTKVRSFSVYFDMNAFEEERSILHCYLAVVYRTMAKRGIIEIDINKRV